MTTAKRIAALAIAGTLAAAGLSGQDFTVRTSVDRNPVALNERFTLSIEISGKGANSAQDPELPVIGAFASFLGSGSSQNISFVNGRMSTSKVFQCYYVATAVGKYQIPPVTVTADGKAVSSAAIDFEVMAAGAQGQGQTQARNAAPGQAAAQGEGPAEGDLFLRASVDRRKVYPNEPVIVTYKLYTRVNVANLSVSKMPATAGFWAEDFDMPQQLQTSHEILDGKQYTVATVRRTALFPMVSGTRAVDPLVLDCDVHVRSRSRDPFADFFDDSFFFGGKTVRRQIRSKPISIEVQPFPETGKPAGFSGLTGRFRISASADKRDVKTNEAITYKVTVEGDGNIRQIPAPEIVFPSDFEVYPPKTSETVTRSGAGISGRRTFEYVLIPRAAGDETLPPVRLSYFDASAAAYRTVSTEAIQLRVEQGAGGGYAGPAVTGLSKEEVRLVGQDIRFIKTADAPFRRAGAAAVPPAALWIGFGLPLAGLAAALARRRKLNRLAVDVAYARGSRASRAVRKRLAAAAGLMKPETQKAFYAEAAKGIQGFLGDKLNIAEAGMLSEDVSARLSARGVRPETIQAVFSCLNTCDMKRFSPETATQAEMKAFYGEVEKAVSRLERELR
ncbi:MAG: BatD family protein [bacterium]|nr:BatD family protein [bacterium]